MYGKIKKVHFIGIGGIGMSGIAEVLINMGLEVSGSDLAETQITQRLASLGAVVHTGHSSENIKGSEVVVYSSAIRKGQSRDDRRRRCQGSPSYPGRKCSQN